MAIPEAAPRPQALAGITPLMDRYAGWLVDQWGVIHDGERALGDGVAALARLREAGRRVVLLSNSGRRRAHSLRHLAALGIGPELYDEVVTSGEVAWRLLRERRLEPFRTLGRRCLLFTRFGDLEVVAGLDLELVDDPAAADFIFLSGVDSPKRTLDDYRPVLEVAARRRLWMVCANPDRVAPQGERLIMAPGTVAALYERLGGRVVYTGKPHPPIYAMAQEALAVPPAATVAVGDSFEHDVVGARRAGLDVLFVLAGIHAREFPPELDEAAVEARILALARRHGVLPQGWLWRFRP